MDEAEVALVGHLNTEEVGVAGIEGALHLVIERSVIRVVTLAVVDDEVVDLLVEHAGADQTDALEVVLGVQVEVVRECRLQVGVAEGNLILVYDDVGHEVGILRARERVGEGEADFQVVAGVVLGQERGEHVDVALSALARGGEALVGVRLLAVVIDPAAVIHAGVFEADAGHELPLLANLLVKAEVARGHRLGSVEVLGLFVEFLFLFETAGVFKVEVADVFLVDKVAGLVAVAGHVSVAVLAGQVLKGVADEGVLVGGLVVVEVDVLVFVPSP